MRVLFLHPGALGDIILSLPAIALLRERLCPSEITIAGNLDYLGAVAEGYADSVRSLSAFPIARLFGADPLPGSDLTLWRAYDRIVSWTGARDPAFRAKLGTAHECAIIAEWKPGPGDARHVSQIFADSLSPWLGRASEVRPASLRLAPAARNRALRWLEGKAWNGSAAIVALHPGAGSEAKRWPRERFAAVAGLLTSRPALRVLLVEGPAEEGLAERLPDYSDPARMLVARSLPLPALMAVLSECRAFLGNDSGIAHLAAGLGLPCVVLFGPTAPEHWAPLGPAVKVLRSNSACSSCRGESDSVHTCMAEIGVATVMAAISAAVQAS